MGRMKLVEGAGGAPVPPELGKAGEKGAQPIEQPTGAGTSEATEAQRTGLKAAADGAAAAPGGLAEERPAEIAAMAAAKALPLGGRSARREREPVPIEPALVLDSFVTGVMPPEDHGDHVRITCYADRPHGRATERVIVARLVFPRSAFLAALGRIAKTFAGSEAPAPTPPALYAGD